LNITGITDISMVHIHKGKSGENGKPVLDLLSNGNKLAISNGLTINGSITNSNFIGPLRGKTISDLVCSINDGNNYVNIHTQVHPNGEIRGQLQLSGSSNMTLTKGSETDTKPEIAIVTPTKE